jgi:hypothetical protein
MLQLNSDFCGSHELRIDCNNKTIQAVRFPTNVSMSLNAGPYHSLLHPASAIYRAAFYKCGTLSEERIFANDTKFLLNSFFHLDHITNIDDFLYIRRKHPDSLTNEESTRIGSPERLQLLRTWTTHFELIKMRFLNLGSSSLVFQPTSYNVTMQTVSSGSAS